MGLPTEQDGILTPPAGGGSSSLFRGYSDQGQERKARGQDGDRCRDLGYPESDRPAQVVPVAPGHVGIPPGHVGPETLRRSLKVGLQCLHAFLRHGNALRYFMID